MRDCPRREHDQSHHCLVAAPCSPSRARHDGRVRPDVRLHSSCHSVPVRRARGQGSNSSCIPGVELCRAALKRRGRLAQRANAVVPHEPRAGKPPGYRVLHLVGFLTRNAAAEQICQLSKDCKLDAVAMRRKFSELDEFSAQEYSAHGCRLTSLRLMPLHVEASKQVEREHAAG